MGYVQPARTSSAAYFGTMADAYASLPVPAGGTIQARQFTFVEQLTLNHNIPVTLAGGFNPAYTSTGGYTSVRGNLTVALGSLTVDRVVVR